MSYFLGLLTRKAAADWALPIWWKITLRRLQPNLPSTKVAGDQSIQAPENMSTFLLAQQRKRLGVHDFSRVAQQVMALYQRATMR